MSPPCQWVPHKIGVCGDGRGLTGPFPAALRSRGKVGCWTAIHDDSWYGPDKYHFGSNQLSETELAGLTLVEVVWAGTGVRSWRPLPSVRSSPPVRTRSIRLQRSRPWFGLTAA